MSLTGAKCEILSTLFYPILPWPLTVTLPLPKINLQMCIIGRKVKISIFVKIETN